MAVGIPVSDPRIDLEPWTAGDVPWTERDLDVPEPGDPRRPGPGEAFDPNDWHGEDLVVVDGVEVVPPVFPQGCPTGGFDADLVITGDVDEVVEAYREQFRPFGDDEPVRRDREVVEGMRTELGTSSVGGTSLQLVIVDEGGEGPAWGAISRCDD